MQLHIKTLACLTLLSVVWVMVASTGGTKIVKCCTKASTKKISDPILGFRIQRRSLPCVRAVIFQTAKEDVCSHWKEDWVLEKIKELKQAQMKTANSETPTISSPQSSTTTTTTAITTTTTI